MGSRLAVQYMYGGENVPRDETGLAGQSPHPCYQATKNLYLLACTSPLSQQRTLNLPICFLRTTTSQCGVSAAPEIVSTRRLIRHGPRR